MPLKVWYEEGLTFGCTGCGGCCTGAPGYVWLTEKDVANFLNYLQISRDEFLKKYCRIVNGAISLLEDPKSYDCVFLKGKECTAYHARPNQCRTFPFWKSNLTSKKSWDGVARQCEGIDNPEGKTYSCDEIKELTDHHS